MRTTLDHPAVLTGAVSSPTRDEKSATQWSHRCNLVRVPYIRDAACRQFSRDAALDNCLEGLRILDVGCGPGVLCEALALLGADVVGLDPAKSEIELARRHAAESDIIIDYRRGAVDSLAQAGEQFDIVLAMEVIEHVSDPDAFIDGCAELVKPGGLVILSSINRTAKSFVMAIVVGEYMFRLAPIGSHRWRQFVRPDEMRSGLEQNMLDVVDMRGITLNARTGDLRLADDMRVCYLLTAVSPTSRDMRIGPDSGSLGFASTRTTLNH